MKEKILLIRFSALGDVLMTVPVVDALARQYPDLDITMVSRPNVESIITLLPENVHFKGIEPHSYSKFFGVFQIYRDLAALKPDKCCNLHNVLRTNIIELLFRLSGIPTSRYVKDRKARRIFIKSRPVMQQITTFQRYSQALSALGYPVSIHPDQPFSLITAQDKINAVGIAPFASYDTKIYPLESMEKVVSRLSSEVDVYLFGAGKKEKEILERWEQQYPGTHCVAGTKKSLAEELVLISKLSVMVTMDSANMHLASLAGVPVVSIWGATHPSGGFLGWGQAMTDIVQSPINCRPCSIYGSKPCKSGNYACLNDISVETIYKKVMERLLFRNRVNNL